MKRNPQAGRQRLEGALFQLLTEDDLADIHYATLEVLQRTGVWIEDEEARQIYGAGGAEVDDEQGIVRIPPRIVEEAVRTAPSKLVLCGRNPKNDLVIEGGRVGFTTFGEGIKIVDPYTGEVRDPTIKDFAASARLADYLSDVDVYQRAFTAFDVPAETAGLHQAEAWMTNTSKHGMMGSGNRFLTRKLVKMAASVVGGFDNLRRRPIISFVTCPVSPLKLVRDSCEIIIESARAGIACNILSMAMAGGSSPVTLAGTLVTHNAEVLAGIVLNQLTSAGSPVIYGSSTTAMDLRFAAASVGTPECGMISAGVAQLARFYLLPSWVAGA